MHYTITPPASIRVKIDLPASKSISNRVLILNALSDSKFPVENLSDSDDTRVLKKALLSLRTTGDAHFDVGAAGAPMRFLTAYLAQRKGVWTITGTERMKNRPIKILVDSLRKIGGEIDYLEKEGFPPLRIYGKKLAGGTINLDGSVSSQYLSALLMIAPLTEQGLTIYLEGNIVSRPYIDMTFKLLDDFGVKAVEDGQQIFIAPQVYCPIPFKIENDWSAASYWYEIAALAGDAAEIELTGLEQNSIQGDARVAELFESLTSPLRRAVDFAGIPDLAQTFAVTCCLLNIPFHFTGLQSLRIKETDRIAALQTELKKLGYIIKSGEAEIEWTGERCEADPDPIISTYDDHRMAMAFAPACLKIGKIRINHPEVVSKSYPNFWKDIRKAGFNLIR